MLEQRLFGERLFFLQPVPTTPHARGQTGPMIIQSAHDIKAMKDKAISGGWETRDHSPPDDRLEFHDPRGLLLPARLELAHVVRERVQAVDHAREVGGGELRRRRGVGDEPGYLRLLRGSRITRRHEKKNEGGDSR